MSSLDWDHVTTYVGAIENLQRQVDWLRLLQRETETCDLFKPFQLLLQLLQSNSNEHGAILTDAYSSCKVNGSFDFDSKNESRTIVRNTLLAMWVTTASSVIATKHC